MRKISVVFLTFLVAFLIAAPNISAQITINIPKLPKIKKDKPKQPTTEQPPATVKTETVVRQEEDQSNEPAEPEPVRDECESNAIAGLVVDEVTQMTTDIESYTPDRSWFTNVIPTYKYLLMSVSPSAKREWQNDFKSIGNCPKILSGLESLGVAASKKLPLLLPDKTRYAIRNAAEETLMKSKIRDLANHKIHYIGIRQANWLIEKNDFGIPTARYKHGMVWVRYTPNDHPFCRAYYINIIQDYAGGGRYGASYANFVDESLVGCPPGAK